jgi:hypothetical protein
MGQLVGNQFLSCVAPGIKTSRFEDKFVTNGVGQGIHGAGRGGCSLVSMYPDVAEIVSETRFKE